MQTFAGGPLARKSGDALVAAGVKLCSVYGATELGSVSKAFDWEAKDSNPPVKSLKDWEWMQISDLTTPRWDAQGDGTFELNFLVRCLLGRFKSVILTRYADMRWSPTRRGKSPRRQGIRHCGSFRASSN